MDKNTIKESMESILTAVNAIHDFADYNTVKTARQIITSNAEKVFDMMNKPTPSMHVMVKTLKKHKQLISEYNQLNSIIKHTEKILEDGKVPEIAHAKKYVENLQRRANEIKTTLSQFY